MNSPALPKMITPSSSALEKLPQQAYIFAARRMRWLRSLGAQSACPSHIPSSLIFHASKKVLLLIPKVASRTLLGTFGTNEYDGVEVGPLVALDFDGDLKGYEVAALVRDPIERALSCHEDKIARLDYTYARASRIARYRNLHAFMQLEQFARWLNTEEGSDAHADAHWASQHRIAGNYRGAPRATCFFRLENMGPDFQDLFAWAGFQPNEIVPVNKTPLKQVEYRADIGVDVIKLLSQRYATDMEQYGYGQR